MLQAAREIRAVTRDIRAMKIMVTGTVISIGILAMDIEIPGIMDPDDIATGKFPNSLAHWTFGRARFLCTLAPLRKTFWREMTGSLDINIRQSLFRQIFHIDSVGS